MKRQEFQQTHQFNQFSTNQFFS